MKSGNGLPTSINDPDIINTIDHFHNQIVLSGPSADQLLKTVDNYPDQSLLQTYAASLYLYVQDNQATHLAEKYLIAAEKNIRSANLREQLMYQAVRNWFHLDYEGAITLFKTITTLYPCDTLALKFAEWLFYCTGQAYQAEKYLEICQPMVEHNKDDPGFLAMHSFALELCGYMHEAEEKALKAVSINPITPWAHHTLAHYYLNTNQIEQGINTLRSLQPTWKNILPPLRGHNTWHLALFHLANLNENEVMRLYPNIFGSTPDICLEQLDGISLLWRLDLAGIHQPKYYTNIVAHIGKHPYEQYTGFNSVHYIYCLTKANENAHALDAINAIKDYTNHLPNGNNKNYWATIVIPFCHAIHAFAKEDYQLSHQLMTPIISNCYQLGGSDAQDELFNQTYLVNLLKLNKNRDAKQFFDATLSHYKKTPLENYWFK